MALAPLYYIRLTKISTLSYNYNVSGTNAKQAVFSADLLVIVSYIKNITTASNI